MGLVEGLVAGGFEDEVDGFGGGHLWVDAGTAGNYGRWDRPLQENPGWTRA